jgi:crotonobetainyl-CoA:carnitine CoA-transferase CaiB-like acyl-CoA transferase
MTPPLDGLRIVDLTQGYVAYCGSLLADLGASVLKVETPDGDYQRRLGPPFLGDDAAAFVAVNRGKRSVVLDWRDQDQDQQKAREHLDELIRRADAVITDLHPDEAEPAGLDYAGISRINPRVIHCSITPFGDTGPDRNKRATELEIQGISGLWRYLGSLNEAPIRQGVPMAAMCASIFGCQAIIAALVHRGKNGVAQQVSVSQLGALLTMQTVQFVSESEPDEWIGHCLSPYREPNRGYRTKDRAILWDFMDDDGFRTFCTEIGLPELGDDPRIARTNPSRWQNMEALRPTFEAAFADRPADDLVARVRELGGNAVPYHTFESLSRDPQALVMNLVTTAPRPGGGEMRTIGLPWEFSQTQPDLGKAPLLGEHTQAVLAELTAT